MISSAVLVTDGQLRSSLAVVRSLGRAGYRVFVCSSRRRSLAGASRFAVTEVQVPPALSEPDAFADAIEELVRRWKISVLLPMSEESLLVLLPVAARFPDTIIPFAPIEQFRKAADKQYVLDLASSLGIAVPDQVLLLNHPGTEPVSTGDLRFPVVIKPAHSVAGEGSARTKLGVSYAADRNALAEVLSSLPASAFPVLLQQRIEGPGTGIFLLMWDSRVMAQFAHRRLREKPPSGGVSVCAESIEADPNTVEQARTLLAALNWRGPAMVEFKLDRASGRPFLMEINGRFWGSLQLAIDAGVDFPAILVALALGEKRSPVTTYAVGTRCRWWWGEVDHLIARLRGAAGGYGLGSKSRAVRTFLRPERGTKNEVLRAGDPWPFVRESIDWFQGR